MKLKLSTHSCSNSEKTHSMTHWRAITCSSIMKCASLTPSQEACVERKVIVAVETPLCPLHKLVYRTTTCIYRHARTTLSTLLKCDWLGEMVTSYLVKYLCMTASLPKHI